MASLASLMGGSSPRGRGKPTEGSDLVLGKGLIPAWAGKTRPFTSRRAKCRAHPRVGGENSGVTAGVVASVGSSPRGRGKQCVYRPHMVSFRLIPAWAGKTWCDPRAAG